MMENDGIILCTAADNEIQSLSFKLCFIAVIKGGVWIKYKSIISIINCGFDFVRCIKKSKSVHLLPFTGSSAITFVFSNKEDCFLTKPIILAYSKRSSTGFAM